MAVNMDADHLQYIPQLQLYYDNNRNIYLNLDGTTAHTVANPHRVSDVSEESLNNIRVNLATVSKIIAVVAAIVLQYSVLTNKIADSAEKIQTVNTNISQSDKKIKELELTINKLESQLTITSELINQLQIHMSNDRKK
jgi:hypothetical protein